MTFFSTLKKTFNTAPTAFDVLGVSKFASTAEIKLAYRKLVAQHHPDIIGENARIIEINSAYARLRKAGRV